MVMNCGSVSLHTSTQNTYELRAVRVRAGVGHREQTRLVVLEVEVLVSELLAVDRLAARAVAGGEVTALEHEVGDHTVEVGALVAEALLAGGEGTEVGRGLGHNTGSDQNTYSSKSLNLMVPRGEPFLVMSKKTLDMVREVAANRRANVGAKAIWLLGVRTTQVSWGDTNTYTMVR